MAGLKFLYNLILKDTVKGSGQASGILSIGDSVRKLANKKFQTYVISAQKQGVDLDKLSEQEIKYMLEMNKAKEPRVLSNEEAYEFLNKFLKQGKGKKGEVIEFPKDKVKNLTKAKSRPPETEIIGGIQTTRGLGDVFPKQLEKTVTVRTVIEDIKKLEPIESMKETNRVLKGEGKYKNLSKADKEKIAGDESVTDHIFERNIIDEPEDFAYGGVAGLLGERPGYGRGYLVEGAKSLGKKYKGSTLQAILENPKLLGAELGHDGLMELFNLLPSLFADGGRAEYKDGKGPKMSRRNFLKIMGGLAALPVVGKLFKFTKPLAKTAKVADLTSVPIGNAAGMPAWFKPLVNKVIKEGEEIGSGAERVIVHKTKLPNSKTDVYVTQELDTGHVGVEIGSGKHGFADGKFGQPVRLEYKASELIEPPIVKEGKVVGHGKGTKTKEEFNVEEAEFTGGHPENVKFEEISVNKFGKHESDFSEVEAFATGKTKKGARNVSESFDKMNEDIADRFANYPRPDDYASGGLAHMVGE